MFAFASQNDTLNEISYFASCRIAQSIFHPGYKRVHDRIMSHPILVSLTFATISIYHPQLVKQGQRSINWQKDPVIANYWT